MGYIEWYVFGAAALFALCLVFCKGIFDEWKKKKEFIKSLREDYGKRTTRKCGEEELRNISRYYQYRGAGTPGNIDDITWNDLGMDHIFMKINHTWSQPGQEYLYDCLRRPVEDQAELLERERVISYFVGHEDERVRLQAAFASMGRIQKLSVYDYLDLLSQIPGKSNLPHYFCCAAAVFSMVMIFAKPTVGFAVFIAAMFVNLFIYFRRKGEIEPYITTFGYLMRMMRETKKIVKLRVPELSVYFDEMEQALDATKKFRQNSYILMSGKKFTGDFLEIPLDYLRMFLHLDLMKFNSMLKAVRDHMEDVLLLIHHVGFLDAMVAAGEFRVSLPIYCTPEFVREKCTVYEAEELIHPLLAEAVPSSVCAKRGILITGSNASGKSTFLKAAAVAAVLAETLYTVPAKRYRSSFFHIYSSMAISDDIFMGESYYMAEIRSLKRVLDAAEGGRNILCFVDEVLRGTNTVERIAASSHILKSLDRENVICFAATHDIELTYILENLCDNYHFTELVEGNDISFPYRLLEGRADTRNAIRLLRMIGYREEITREAEEDGKRFVEDGVWRVFEADE